MPPSAALQPQALYASCAPASLNFRTTAEVPDIDAALVHPRAIEALHLGLDIRHAGYNLFLLGDTGSGRHAIVEQLLDAERRSGEPPADWCYVYNFAEAARPDLLRVPCGRGARLRDDMQHFVSELLPAIGAVFQSDEYRSRVEAMQEEEKQREEAARIKAAIMDLLRDNPAPILVREIGEKVGGNARQIGRLSTELIDAGKIERVHVRGISCLKYIRG